MSMSPEMAVRMGYFRLRVRTHEWAERQRVSLLDVDGIGKAYLRMLYACDLSTADRIMATPTGEIVARLSHYPNFPQTPDKAQRTVLAWKRHLVELWRAHVGETLPESWQIDA
ncbi:MAG: helix-hairpin-helix domain-containing protein [Phycisphaerales bacterium]|nr:helix-hairpin-helix domain-containing protein [Phycisphaerales bacterium]